MSIYLLSILAWPSLRHFGRDYMLHAFQLWKSRVILGF